MRTVFSVLAVGALCVLATASSAQSGRLFLDEAPLDKAIDFPKEKLAEYYAKMTKDTIDVWVIQEGGGTLVTGGEEVDGKHRGGIERQVKVGDVIFIPAGIYHGMKDSKVTTWLNIRFPE